MKKGDLLKVKISGYAFEGMGTAKIDADKMKTEYDKSTGKEILIPQTKDEGGFVVFVPGGYPEDFLIASIKKKKKNYAETKLEKIISPSPLRIKARCKFFGECGGCRQQDMDYDHQIKFKQRQVEEVFKRIGRIDNFIIEDILPSEKIFFYRNKMEFSFSNSRWLTEKEISSGKELEKNFALGLHTPKVYNKVLDIDECFLQSELSSRILNFTRSFFKERNILPYTTRTHTGFLRNLVIRQSAKTKDLMVNLVTSEENDNLLINYTKALLKNFPQITTIVNNINRKKASVAAGDYEKIYFGDDFIYDKIGKYKFRISANSFFQTNTLQAEKLYNAVLEFAQFKGDEVVYDLYAGGGTIAVFISDAVKEVYGFESVEEAVKDSDANLELNNIKNVKTFTADLDKSFLPLIDSVNIPQPDVLIIDPPRSGMHKNTINDVIKLNSKKIIYVSCNPATQARDVKLLTEAGYKLIKIRPVDMFPHTWHIENVALLIK